MPRESSMLRQAVIDAEQLREQALKTAENSVLEKYSADVKEQMELLLEQDPEMEGDPGIDISIGDEQPTSLDPVAADIPLAATEGENACQCPDEEEEIEIDFDQLAAQMDAEEETMEQYPELGTEEEPTLGLSEDGQLVTIPETTGAYLHNFYESMDDPIYEIGSLAMAGKPIPRDLLETAIELLENKSLKLNENDIEYTNIQEIINILKEYTPIDTNYGYSEGISEMDEITDDVLESILETLEVDIENVPMGHDLGVPDARKEEAQDIALARLQDDKVKEDLEQMQSAVDRLKEEKEKLLEQNKSLKLKYNKFKGLAEKSIVELKKMSDLSLTNAKLLYENRILKSDSLNERQKKVLVERLLKVGSVGEAKAVFDTAEVEDTTKKNNSSESLNEHVERGNLLTLKTQTAQPNPKVIRQQELAGIIKRK